MKFTAVVALGAVSAAAQSFNLSSIGSNPTAAALQLLSGLSTSCQTTLITLATNSNLSTCLNFTALPSIFTSYNASLPPEFDQYLALTCGENPCSAATLNSTAMMLSTGCSAELSQYNVSNTTVQQVFSYYPLAREIACLKTTKPFNTTNATIPITSPPYNLTNGTFCVTSLMTEVSTYLGQNLTLPYLLSLAQGNKTAIANATLALSKIPVNATCNDCIFATVDILEQRFPALVNLTVAVGNTTNYTVLGMSFSAPNVTLKYNGNGTYVNAFLNNTCAASNFSVSTNGTLPKTINVGAYNSTYRYNLTNGNQTYMMGTLLKRVHEFDAAMLKGRWIGAQ